MGSRLFSFLAKLFEYAFLFSTWVTEMVPFLLRWLYSLGNHFNLVILLLFLQLLHHRMNLTGWSNPKSNGFQVFPGKINNVLAIYFIIVQLLDVTFLQITLVYYTSHQPLRLAFRCVRILLLASLEVLIRSGLRGDRLL